MKIEQLEGDIGEIENKIYIIGAAYMKEIDILTSMKGISVFTAIALIADIAIIERFQYNKLHRLNKFGSLNSRFGRRCVSP